MDIPLGTRTISKKSYLRALLARFEWYVEVEARPSIVTYCCWSLGISVERVRQHPCCTLTPANNVFMLQEHFMEYMAVLAQEAKSEVPSFLALRNNV